MLSIEPRTPTKLIQLFYFMREKCVFCQFEVVDLNIGSMIFDEALRYALQNKCVFFNMVSIDGIVSKVFIVKFFYDDVL